MINTPTAQVIRSEQEEKTERQQRLDAVAWARSGLNYVPTGATPLNIEEAMYDISIESRLAKIETRLRAIEFNVRPRNIPHRVFQFWFGFGLGLGVLAVSWLLYIS